MAYFRRGCELVLGAEVHEDLKPVQLTIGDCWKLLVNNAAAGECPNDTS